jgi:hypothetical protein
MFKPKQKQRLILLLCVAAIVLGAVMLANAYDRPHNATMDYVPQNLGIYDTYYCNFKESDCRACHGTTTAWRHHANQYAVSGQCASTCHSIGTYTSPERDCKVCHVDGGPMEGLGVPAIGPLGFPHHRTGLAGAGICTACHSSTLVSDANSIEPPQFDPTTITPTPVSCENCHWPTGLVAEGTPPLQDWNLWTSFPRPTTWPDSLAHPAPIEANGPVMTGSVLAGDPPPTSGKPYRPLTGTHHEADGLVSPNCVLCHGTAPGGGYQLDPTYPYAIRACENCHDIFTLHNGITEHTTDGIGGTGLGGYTVNGSLNQIVVQDQKCVACHSDVIGAPMPQAPVSPTPIGYLDPPMASAGVEVTIYAGGAPGFGDQGPYDRVVMQQGVSGLIPVAVSSWGNDKIVFEVPGAVFAPGFVNVGVQKHYLSEILGDNIGNEDSICDPGEACQDNTQTSVAPGGGFYLRQHPILNFLSPDSGTWNTVVTINGVTGSFFSTRENIYDQTLTSCDTGDTCYGFSTYVELVASNDRYRVTEMSGDPYAANDTVLGEPSYFSNSIKVNINKMPVGPTSPLAGYGTLLDVNTDYYTPLADLYKGNWQLYVITDFFKKNTPGVTGNNPPYMLKHSSGHLTGKINTADYTLEYREVSDPLPFFATDTPFISSNAVSSIRQNSLGAVYGINFGTTQDTSTVYVTKCDGSMTPLYALTVVQWANTRVVFRAPASPPIPGGGANGCIMVRVPKAAPNPTDSNLSEPIRFYP